MNSLWAVAAGVVGLLIGLLLGERVGYAAGRLAHLMEREHHGEPMKGRPSIETERAELLRAGREFGAPRTADDRPVRHTPRRTP